MERISKDKLYQLGFSTYFTTDPQETDASLAHEKDDILIHQPNENNEEFFIEVRNELVKVVYFEDVANFMLAEEQEKITAQMNREFIDYAVLGKPLHYLNGEVVDELLGWPDSVVITEEYNLEEIIEKFNPSKETIEAIKKIQKL